MRVTSADSCRMGEIEGVKTVELVYVDGLLRTGGDPSLGGHLLEVGSLSNRSRMCE